MLDTKKKEKPKVPDPYWESEEDSSLPCVIYPETAMASGRVTTPQGDLRFLNVRGSMQGMARQLGARTSTEIRKGAVPFFARYLEQTLQNSPIHRIRGVMQWATHQWVTRRLRENIPREFAQAIEAYADAAGMDLDTLHAAYLMPETFLWVLGTYHRVLGSRRAFGLGTPPMCGCTSAIFVPTDTGAPLHGRNFDYFGIDYWDQFATVIFYHPDDGLDYVAVSSAGFLGGGVTSMNAAGLTLAVHQHFVDRFDLDGVPVGIAGDEVMRRAHTIEEAVSILRDFPPVAGWTYVMSEGDSGRAAIYEVAPGKENLHFIKPEQQTLGYANVYWGEGFKPTEIDYYPEYRRCNHGRQSRVVEALNDLVDRGEGAG
ncbi:MAG: C45 family autoproteolytic acyltransferase/hydrolase, partial [Bradymonadaceae bacterium]